MVANEEWEECYTLYRRIYTEIIEWCTTQITIIRKKKVPSRVGEAETMLREFNNFIHEMGLKGRFTIFIRIFRHNLDRFFPSYEFLV